MSTGFDETPTAPSARIDIVAALAGEIGPRPAGGAAEARAAEAVARAFDLAGVASVQLPVRVRPPGRWETLLYAPAALLAVLLGLWQPWAGLAVAALVLGGCAADINGRPLLTRALPRVPSRNVLALVAPARQEIRRLVALADLDSAAPIGPARLGALAGARAARLALLPTQAALVATLLARALAANRWTLGLLEVEAGALMLLLTWAGWLTWRGAAAPGAIANASGVAALVDLAAHARAFPPNWIETWFLAASAGAANADGLRAFLAANSFDVDSTYFIQLQSVGAGDLRAALAEGDIFPRRASPLLARLIALAGNDKPAVAARPLRRLARATQNAVVLSRGYDAITLVGVDRSGARGAPGDDPAAVEPAAIQRAVGLLIGVLERLDAEADERNRRARLARASAGSHSRD